MSDDSLFVLDEGSPVPPDDRSADQRRTDRQAQAVRVGVHPLALVFRGIRMHSDADLTANRGDVRDLPLRCGSCVYRVGMGHHNRSHPKCLFSGSQSPTQWQSKPARVSHSAATDVRAWWPACSDYSPGDTGLSPDAARWIPEAAS